ncbi:hypothetical protein [Sandaracinus amylolyticus]|uniref:hypothetical protein n=1 Tax=Sandaracinus amylolyticus TaxID=927083 RepID=UPI001F19AC71|nr:hypothetical protein [Sandaracinus amylolyticus]
MFKGAMPWRNRTRGGRGENPSNVRLALLERENGAVLQAPPAYGTRSRGAAFVALIRRHMGMDWKKLAWCAALAGSSMSLVACGGDDGGDDTMDPVTHTYVVSTISIPMTSQRHNEPAPGFNLDGVDSDGSPTGATCVDRSPDYTSSNDPGESGVDNALGGLVDTIGSLLGDGDLDATLAEQITEGSLLIMMQVRDVNSYTNDSSVQVQLYLGSVPGGGAPMVSGSALAPGQTFEGTAIGSVQTGSIVNGRLRVETDLLTLAINTGDVSLDLNIRDAQVRANITPTALANGAIGGSVRVEEIAEAAEEIMAGLGDTVLTVLGGVADLEPTADDPLTCESLSVGILFGGVEAQLSGG